MTFVYDYLFPAMWLSYFVYWWAKSTDVKVTEQQEPVLSQRLRLVAMICAIALLCLPSVPLPLLNNRFLPRSPLKFWIAAATTAAGLLFSVLGRRHLGKNWSQAVTVKEDHELITTGPYGLVRHPIYTGLLLGLLGSAVALGQWRRLVAVALVFATLWHKLKFEETLMRAHFGEPYDAYSRRVSALVPHIL